MPVPPRVHQRGVRGPPVDQGSPHRPQEGGVKPRAAPHLVLDGRPEGGQAGPREGAVVVAAVKAGEAAEDAALEAEAISHGVSWGRPRRARGVAPPQGGEVVPDLGRHKRDRGGGAARPRRCNRGAAEDPTPSPRTDRLGVHRRGAAPLVPGPGARRFAVVGTGAAGGVAAAAEAVGAGTPSGRPIPLFIGAAKAGAVVGRGCVSSLDQVTGTPSRSGSRATASLKTRSGRGSATRRCRSGFSSRSRSTTTGRRTTARKGTCTARPSAAYRLHAGQMIARPPGVPVADAPLAEAAGAASDNEEVPLVFVFR